MLDKRTLLGSTGCVLLTLVACSSAPPTPRVAVTLAGQEEATFISTRPLVFTHARPGTFMTIVAHDDAGAYGLELLVATPLRPGTYTHLEALDPTAGTFNAELSVCGDGPSCTGVASSAGGTMTVIRADKVISGELTVDLKNIGGGDFGDAAATFTLPPAQVVP